MIAFCPDWCLAWHVLRYPPLYNASPASSFVCLQTKFPIASSVGPSLPFARSERTRSHLCLLSLSPLSAIHQAVFNRLSDWSFSQINVSCTIFLLTMNRWKHHSDPPRRWMYQTEMKQYLAVRCNRAMQVVYKKSPKTRRRWVRSRHGGSLR